MLLPPVQPASHIGARSLRGFDEYNAAVFRAFFEPGEDDGVGCDPENTSAAHDKSLGWVSAPRWWEARLKSMWCFRVPALTG